MRKFIVLSALVVMSMLIAACGGDGGTGGGGASGDSPDAAARNWFTAYFNGDVEAVGNLTCAAQRDAMVQGAEAIGAVEAEYDLSGLSFSVTEQTDTTAVVTGSGSVRVTAAGQTVEQPVDQSGVPPTLNLVREDNAWKVCP